MNRHDLIALLEEAAQALQCNLTLRQPLIDELLGYAAWLRDVEVTQRCETSNSVTQ